MKNPYEELEDRFKRMDALNGALSMLYWDMSAMMPPGGVESRSEQLAVLKTLHHSMMTDPVMPDLLEGAESDQNLDDWEQAKTKITEGGGGGWWWLIGSKPTSRKCGVGGFMPLQLTRIWLKH